MYIMMKVGMDIDMDLDIKLIASSLQNLDFDQINHFIASEVKI
jgi:hypothetical protein